MAEKVYENRILAEKAGDAHSDWVKAEAITHSFLKAGMFAANRLLIAIRKEKYLETIRRHLDKSVFLDIINRLSPSLEALGVLLIPVVLYLASQSYEERQKAQENERLQRETVRDFMQDISAYVQEIDGSLKDEKNKKNRIISQSLTLALLRDPNLNEQRKGQVMEFLIQMNLVQGIVTDDSPDLGPPIRLGGVDLKKIELIDANLKGSQLTVANCSGLQTRSLMLANGSILGSH